MAPPSSFPEGPHDAHFIFATLEQIRKDSGLSLQRNLPGRFRASSFAAAVPCSAAKFTQQDPAGPEGTSSMSKAIRIPSLFLAITLIANAQTAIRPVVRAVSKPAAASADAATQSQLPVTRGALYKNGVGFFEHAGRVTGDQSVTIDFT